MVAIGSGGGSSHSVSSRFISTLVTPNIPAGFISYSSPQCVSFLKSKDHEALHRAGCYSMPDSVADGSYAPYGDVPCGVARRKGLFRTLWANNCALPPPPPPPPPPYVSGPSFITIMTTANTNTATGTSSSDIT